MFASKMQRNFSNHWFLSTLTFSVLRCTIAAQEACFWRILLAHCSGYMLGRILSLKSVIRYL